MHDPAPQGTTAVGMGTTSMQASPTTADSTTHETTQRPAGTLSSDPQRKDSHRSDQASPTPITPTDAITIQHTRTRGDTHIPPPPYSALQRPTFTPLTQPHTHTQLPATASLDDQHHARISPTQHLTPPPQQRRPHTQPPPLPTRALRSHHADNPPDQLGTITITQHPPHKTHLPSILPSHHSNPHNTQDTVRFKHPGTPSQPLVDSPECVVTHSAPSQHHLTDATPSTIPADTERFSNHSQGLAVKPSHRHHPPRQQHHSPNATNAPYTISHIHTTHTKPTGHTTAEPPPHFHQAAPRTSARQPFPNRRATRPQQQSPQHTDDTQQRPTHRATLPFRTFRTHHKQVRFNTTNDRTLLLDNHLPTQDYTTCPLGTLPDLTLTHQLHSHLQPLPPDFIPPTPTTIGLQHAPTRPLTPHTWNYYTDGSFLPDNPTDSGWAIVCLPEDDTGPSFHGTLYHRADTSTSIPFPQTGASSRTIELYAIVWALLLTHTYTQQRNIIWTDSISAIQAVLHPLQEGPDAPLSQLAHHLYITSNVHNSTTLNHIHGHSLHPYNELADALAKRATKDHNTTLPTPLIRQLKHTKALLWAWLLHTDQATAAAYPPLVSKNGHYYFYFQLRNPQCQHTDVTHHKDTPTAPTTTTTPIVDITLTTVTYNAQTLRTDTATGRRRPAAPKTIRAQFQQHKAHLVAIQEARTDPQPNQPDNCQGYYIVTGGSDKGRGGIELWVNTDEPYGNDGRRDYRFSRDHVRVLHTDSRRLLVRLNAPHCNITILAAHVPDHNYDHDHRAAWWRTTDKLLQKYQPHIWLLDANGHLGSAQSKGVGGLGYAETESDNGQLLHTRVIQHNMYVTNTHHHNTDDWTCENSHGARTRIDYEVVCEWLHNTTTAHRVLNDFDNCKLHVDHRPVITTHRWTHKACGHTVGQSPIDLQLTRSETHQQHFAQLLQKVPLPHWRDDPNHNTSNVTHSILTAARKAFRRRTITPNREYITPHTMNLVQVRKRVRKFLNTTPTKRTHKPLPFLTTLHAARQLQTLLPPYLHNYDFSLQVQLLYHDLCSLTEDSLQATTQAAIALLRATQLYIRRRINHDKTMLIRHMSDKVAAAIERGDAREEWRILKQALRFGGRPRKVPYVLPHIETSGGQPAQTNAEVHNAFLEHFASVELAKLSDLTTALNSYNDQRPALAPHHHRDANQVMTLHYLTHHYQHLPRQRAPGPDDIRPDFARAAPEQMARLTHPTLAATQLFTKECFNDKLAFVTPIHKGKGSLTTQRSQYRSITLANIITKAHHTHVRQSLKHILLLATWASQCGGLAHKGTDMAHHQITSTMRLCNAKKQTCITLYLDLVQAFYRTLRQLVVPLHTPQQDLDDLVRDLEIPTALQPALHRAISSDPILTRYTSDPHLLALLTDLNSTSLYKLRQSEKIASARLGTKPGDTLATDLFNLAFSDVIGTLEQRLAQANIGVTLNPSQRVFGIQHPGPRHNSVSFVDDLAAQAITTTNDQALPIATTLCTITHNVVVEHGMQPNYGPNKTALQLTVNGKGTHKLRQQVAKLPDQQLYLPELHIHVPIVVTYKHLGSTTAANGTFNPDAKARSTQALAAAQPLRTINKLKQLDNTHKVRYARAFAISKLTYNMHIWDDPSDRPWRTANHTHLNILRCALGSQRNHDPNVRTTDDHILHMAGTTTLRDQVRWTKLRYLARIIHHAPPTLLDLLDELLDHKDSWSHTILADLQWLDQHLDDDRPRLTWSLPDWISYIADDYPRWIKECTRARLRHQRWDHDQRTTRLWQKQLYSLHTSLTATSPADTQPTDDIPPEQTTRTYVCYQCHYATPSRARMLIHLSTQHQRLDAPDKFITGHVCRICLTDYHTRDRLITHLKGTARCWPAWQQLLELTPLTHQQQSDLEAETHNIRTANVKAGFHKKHANLAPIRLSGPRLPRHLATPQPINRQYTDLLTSTLIQSNADQPTPPTTTLTILRNTRMYVLILQAGPRKQHDVQHHLDTLTAHAHINVQCLTVDIEQHTGLPHIAMWRQAIRNGDICALLVTSRARSWHTQHTERPSRTDTHPWGRPGLPPKQQHRNETDNTNLRDTLILLYDCYDHQVPAIHILPDTAPPYPHPLSLPPIHKLQLQPHTTTVQLHYTTSEQHDGQPSTLMGIYTPTLPANATSHNHHTPHPTTTHSLGYNSTDTTPSSPHNFHLTLARTLHESHNHWPQLHHTQDSTDYTHPLDTFIAPLDPYLLRDEQPHHTAHAGHNHTRHDHEAATAAITSYYCGHAAT